MNHFRSTRAPEQRSGFTLSELLIVVAVVALLAAILFPVFAKAREKEEPHYGCQSNLKEIGEAFDQYLADNNDTYPAAFNDISGTAPGSPYPACPSYGCEFYVPPAGQPDPRQTWETSLLPYLKHLRYYVCPDDSLAGRKNITISNSYKGFPVSYTANGMLSCYTPQDNFTGCYCRGVMCDARQGFYTAGKPSLGYKSSPYSSANSGISSAKINHPESTVAVTESWSADVAPLDSNGNWTKWGFWNEIGGQLGPNANFGSQIPCQIPSAISSNSSTAFDVCGVNGAVSAHHGRYKNLANFLFCDGHVAALSPPTTNPDSSPNQTGMGIFPNNQWDATRP